MLSPRCLIELTCKFIIIPKDFIVSKFIFGHNIYCQRHYLIYSPYKNANLSIQIGWGGTTEPSANLLNLFVQNIWTKIFFFYYINSCKEHLRFCAFFINIVLWPWQLIGSVGSRLLLSSCQYWGFWFLPCCPQELEL